MGAQAGWRYSAEEALTRKVSALRNSGLRLLKDSIREKDRDQIASIEHQIKNQAFVQSLYSDDLEHFGRHIQGFDQLLRRMRGMFADWGQMIDQCAGKLRQLRDIPLEERDGQVEMVAGALREKLDSLQTEWIDFDQELSSTRHDENENRSDSGDADAAAGGDISLPTGQ